MDIPIELYQEILERSDFITQIRLIQLCKYHNENLKIYDFHDINPKYFLMLLDDILKNYKYITKLNASDNGSITDAGLSHMIIIMEK